MNVCALISLFPFSLPVGMQTSGIFSRIFLQPTNHLDHLLLLTGSPAGYEMNLWLLQRSPSYSIYTTSELTTVVLWTIPSVTAAELQALSCPKIKGRPKTPPDTGNVHALRLRSTAIKLIFSTALSVSISPPLCQKMLSNHAQNPHGREPLFIF